MKFPSTINICVTSNDRLNSNTGTSNQSQSFRMYLTRPILKDKSLQSEMQQFNVNDGKYSKNGKFGIKKR